MNYAWPTAEVAVMGAQVSLTFNYLPPGSPEGDYNLHHVRVYVRPCVGACVRACVCHAVFSETTTVTHFW